MLPNHPANRQPVPVYVVYDCRGGRARRYFADGLKRPAHQFYARKLKAGKNPTVVKADDRTLFPDDPPAEGTR